MNINTDIYHFNERDNSSNFYFFPLTSPPVIFLLPPEWPFLRRKQPLFGGDLWWQDDAVKVLHSICQQIWKTQQWPQDWKRSVFIPIPNKGNARECSNYCTIALISHTSKGMLKILQARLQQYVNRELPDVQAGFRKGRGTRDQIANIRWIIEKAKEFQKSNLLRWLS